MKITRQQRRYQERKIVRSMMSKKERRTGYSHLRPEAKRQIYRNLLEMARNYAAGS